VWGGVRQGDEFLLTGPSLWIPQEGGQRTRSALEVGGERQHPAKPGAHPEGRANCHQHTEGEAPPASMLDRLVSAPHPVSSSTSPTRQPGWLGGA